MATINPSSPPSRTSGALVLNINAPLSNYAGDGAVSPTASATPLNNAAPAPGTTVSPAGDSFQKTSTAPFVPNPMATPEQQLNEAYQHALESKNKAEEARNSYFNVASQLNGQAFMNKFSQQQPPVGPQPFGQNAFQTPQATSPQVSQLQQALIQQQQQFQQQLQQLQQAQQMQQLQQAQQTAQQQQEAAQKAAMEAQQAQQLQQAQQELQALQQQQAMQAQMQAQQQAQPQVDPMMQQQMMQQSMQQPYPQQPGAQPGIQNPYDPYGQQAQLPQYNPNDPYNGQLPQYNPNDPAQQMMQQQPQGLAAASVGDLNNMIIQPQSPKDKLDAINEIAMRQQGDRQTYELLKNEAMNSTPGMQPDDANLIRQASLFALGNLLGSPINAGVPTNQLPGMDNINRIINNRSENPAVKAAAVTALGYLNRPQDTIVQNMLKKASKDKNPDVKNAVDQVRRGLMNPAAAAQAGGMAAPGQQPQAMPQGGMPQGMMTGLSPADMQMMAQGMQGMPQGMQMMPQAAAMA